MMKKLLFTFCSLIAFSLTAQTVETVNIDWGFDSNPTASGNANSDRTIEVGDTVLWTWVGSGSHNVESDSANSQSNAETFTSGSTVSAPSTYSYTFTVVGETQYRCSPHASMNGTITVVAEGTLNSRSVQNPKEFRIFPNPSATHMNLEIPSLTSQSLKMEVFDVLGKKVLSKVINKLTSRINVSEWNSGVYLVRLTSSDDTIALTKRFVKL